MTLRLKRLYSNKPDVFEPIEFNAGLSAIVAEIRVPQNRKLDTHNLGKSTVGALIDFCLLKGTSNQFFLFANGGTFVDFVFFLELELQDGRFLTIRRAVERGSRVDIAVSTEQIDGLAADESVWQHTDLPLKRAKLVVDGLLGADALSPWGLRDLIGYLIRTQKDYVDVFQLDKHSGKHMYWKPFVAHLLGMDAERAKELYGTRDELERDKAHLDSLAGEWGGDSADSSVLSGLISSKRREAEKKSQVVESFSFHGDDVDRMTRLVESTEQKIALLNEDSYRLRQLVARIGESLADDEVIFRTEDAERLFREAGVAFGEQLRHDYEQLLVFNREISEERRRYLELQRMEASEQIALIEEDLRTLDEQRREALAVLRESDSLEKYKDLSRELTELLAELRTLEARREAAERLIQLKREYRAKEEKLNRIKSDTELEIAAISADDEGRFGLIRRYFSEILENVLDQKALLAVKLNDAGGLDFTAVFLDEKGTATAGGQGVSYKKTMCIAFDLAVLRAYSDEAFPRFVYHDGAFEQLEKRKKENLLAVFREYSSLGLQPVFSALDLELPGEPDSDIAALSDEEVIVVLHDEGEQGRLFKMAKW